MLKLPFIDRIWTARGHIELDPPRSAADAFARLDPMLQENVTEFVVEGDTLTYEKNNPAAQDKMATFPRGTLQVVQDGGRSLLRYELDSPALLMVFLAPLFFLGFVVAADYVNELEASALEQALEEAAEDDEQEEEPQPLNVIDQWLGAPAPETLAEKQAREEREEAEQDEKQGNHSTTPAKVLAGIFAALWLFGRLFEPWLMRKRLRKALNEPHPRATTESTGPA